MKTRRFLGVIPLALLLTLVGLVVAEGAAPDTPNTDLRFCKSYFGSGSWMEVEKAGETFTLVLTSTSPIRHCVDIGGLDVSHPGWMSPISGTFSGSDLPNPIVYEISDLGGHGKALCVDGAESTRWEIHTWPYIPEGGNRMFAAHMSGTYANCGVEALYASKTAPEEVQPGEEFTYTLKVTYYGVWPVNGVVVTDVIPVGSYPVRILDGGDTNGDVVTWTIGTMDVGLPNTAEVRFVVTTTQTITNLEYTAMATNVDGWQISDDGPPVVTEVKWLRYFLPLTFRNYEPSW